MAQPFGTRASKALSDDGYRLSDFPKLIDEGADLAKRQRALGEAAELDAADGSLNPQDREEAAVRADKAATNAKALERTVEALRERLSERQATERQQRNEAEKEAALAERDAIAERFAELVPGIVDTLTGLFGDVVANEARLRTAGLGREPNAEAQARGVPQNWSDANFAEIAQFAKMSVPAWSTAGRVWPKRNDTFETPLANWDVQQRKIEREVREQSAKREAATWGWYRLTPTKGVQCPAFGARIVFERRGPTALTKERRLGKGWSGGMRRAEAEQLRSLGLNIEEIDRETAEREQAEREAAE